MTDFKTPRTWKAGEAGELPELLNDHLSDQLNAAWVGTTDGQMEYYTSSVAKTAIGSDFRGAFLRCSTDGYPEFGGYPASIARVGYLTQIPPTTWTTLYPSTDYLATTDQNNLFVSYSSLAFYPGTAPYNNDWEMSSVVAYSTDSEIFTIPAGMGGMYLLLCNGMMGRTKYGGGSWTGDYAFRFVKNGSSDSLLTSENTMSEDLLAVGYHDPNLLLGGIFNFDAGDYIELQAYQSSGDTALAFASLLLMRIGDT